MSSQTLMPLSSPSLNRLLNEPEQYSFYQAVRLLQLQLESSEQQHRVGHDSRPDRELVRFSSAQHLGFAGRAISQIEVHPARGQALKAQLQVSFAGLTGANGVLPQHYTELIMARVKQRDHAMRDFFDLFNHRLISLYYRAWEKYRIAEQIRPVPERLVTVGRVKADPFSRILTALTGSRQPLSLMYAGLFSRLPRSARGLELLLSGITGAAVRVDQFVGRWLTLDAGEQTALASRRGLEGQFSRLGVDAAIGSRCWDVSSTLAISIEAHSASLSRALTPAGELNRRLNRLVQEFMGKPLRVHWHLRLPAKHANLLRLGQQPLGLGRGDYLYIPANRRDRWLDIRF
ncbi:type VI secretion system baseplate subunit TssG [Pokkaliibacter plantistimulans]|uniref:Type VI secretion system baseplate subunit TssG n=1 Tax=Proteobacteria bacterium 228 TaxID=2083153 RepID=A0A2S5KNZ6_9PROT|nr:type VI secretion system baseplate subunit TssG [Pokkaliibacter plantistimulans]PPC76259.1 type VI secretion system baseplate subunit TssG [Pokkaliibacter plantistimulans]